MSEENTNETVPAMLSEGEAVIPADKLEEFEALVEDVKAEVAAELEAPVAEEPESEDPKVEEPVVEAVAVVEEPKDEPVENVISSGSQGKGAPAEEAVGLTRVANGVIGTGTVKRKPATKKVEVAEKPQKVAVHSTRNVTWPNVGKVYRGYNIVTQEQAEKWLTRDHIRLATPEEVAQEFGK